MTRRIRFGSVRSMRSTRVQRRWHQRRSRRQLRLLQQQLRQRSRRLRLRQRLRSRRLLRQQLFRLRQQQSLWREPFRRSSCSRLLSMSRRSTACNSSGSIVTQTISSAATQLHARRIRPTTCLAWSVGSMCAGHEQCATSCRSRLGACRSKSFPRLHHLPLCAVRLLALNQTCKASICSGGSWSRLVRAPN